MSLPVRSSYPLSALLASFGAGVAAASVLYPLLSKWCKSSSCSSYCSSSHSVPAVTPKKIIRFIGDDNKTYYGGIADDDKCAYVIAGDLYGEWSFTNKRVKVKSLLAPIQPTAILCAGLNYLDHARECNLKIPVNPVLFMKNPAAACAHLDNVVLPKICEEPPQLDYECELAVVIGRPCKNVSVERALDYVLGYTCANDVSARTWQLDPVHCGSQWCRGKSFDGFAPLGPHIVLRDAIPDVQNLKITCSLNGVMLQNGTTKDMVFSVAQLISFFSQQTTLLPGTVILTGTPAGVGFTRKPPIFVKAGDVMDVYIEGIGTLTNKVISQSESEAAQRK